MVIYKVYDKKVSKTFCYYFSQEDDLRVSHNISTFPPRAIPRKFSKKMIKIFCFFLSYCADLFFKTKDICFWCFLLRYVNGCQSDTLAGEVIHNWESKLKSMIFATSVRIIRVMDPFFRGRCEYDAITINICKKSYKKRLVTLKKWKKWRYISQRQNWSVFFGGGVSVMQLRYWKKIYKKRLRKMWQWID